MYQDIQSEQEQHNLASELVNFLYGQAKSTIAGSFVISTCLVYGLYVVASETILFSWYAYMLSTMLIRYILIKGYNNSAVATDHPILWRNLFTVAVCLTGIGWAIAGTMLVPSQNILQTFLVCALAGAAAGTIPFFSASRAATFAFVLPTLLPFAVWCFLQHDKPHDLLGILTSFYLSFLSIFCIRSHYALRNAIKLKFENRELVTNLTLAQNKMQMINQELQSEINERKFVEKLLRDSEEQYRLVTDALPVLISYIDMQYRYQFINRAHEEWFGKPLNELAGRPIRDVIDNTTFTIFAEYAEKLQDNKPITYETIMKFKKQEERYVSVTLIPHIKNAEMQGFFSLISDITPRINYLATHDSLTDLPNRSFFNVRFTQALKRAQAHHIKVALLFLDLDHFKNINDTLGHDVGDMLLIKAAERIKSCLQEVDVFARLGGDEFVIMIDDANMEQVIHVANNICHAFSRPFQFDGRDVFVTASMGISIYPDDGTDMQILLKNSDIAIYRAKEQGRNTFKFYTQEMNEQILKKINIETNLRSALEKNELMIHYQPIIDVASNAVTSLEALLRWQQADNSFITPSEFIPIAEETGLIVSIGEWVLRTACQQRLHWDNFNVKIAVNLSARQFREKHFSDMIKTILKEAGLDGQCLILELTESLIMHDIEYSTKVINALKDIGIVISIDDFGTGYSSLNYLRRFPIDILKIDRSFITDVTGTGKHSADATAIVKAILAMAHSLKMKVVAEGVETTEQFQFLKEHGCDEIQGYLFSQPLATSEMTTLLQKTLSIEDFLKQRQQEVLQQRTE